MSERTYTVEAHGKMKPRTGLTIEHAECLATQLGQQGCAWVKITPEIGPKLETDTQTAFRHALQIALLILVMFGMIVGLIFVALMLCQRTDPVRQHQSYDFSKFLPIG